MEKSLYEKIVGSKDIRESIMYLSNDDLNNVVDEAIKVCDMDFINELYSIINYFDKATVRYVASSIYYDIIYDTKLSYNFSLYDISLLDMYKEEVINMKDYSGEFSKKINDIRLSLKSNKKEEENCEKKLQIRIKLLKFLKDNELYYVYNDLHDMSHDLENLTIALNHYSLDFIYELAKLAYSLNDIDFLNILDLAFTTENEAWAMSVINSGNFVLISYDKTYMLKMIVENLDISESKKEFYSERFSDLLNCKKCSIKGENNIIAYSKLNDLFVSNRPNNNQR